MLSDKNYSWLFNGLQTTVALEDGAEVVPINFDNAATTPAFKAVDDFILQNILMYGSVGRSGHKSKYCTHAYELSRRQVLNFFGVPKENKDYEVIYVKNTTEGINLLSHLLCQSHHTKVLTTRMEHHSNDLPWRDAGHVYYSEVTEEGRHNLKAFEDKLEHMQGTIKYVTVTAASNVTGYISPLHQMAKIAHQYGAKIIVDGAQIVAHRAINLLGQNEDETLDAFIFSGHKMYAPFGEGIIIVKKELIEDKVPYLQGGGMAEYVFDDDVYYKPSPYKDEAGTPNFLGAMAIIAAMETLKQIGYEEIKSHEELLSKKMMKGLLDLKEVEVYGEHQIKDRVGVITFNVKDHSPYEIGELLQNKRAIAVRTGCFCTQPYVMRLLHVSDEMRYSYMKHPELRQPGMVRVSFGLYNTEEEVDEFLNVLETISKY